MFRRLAPPPLTTAMPAMSRAACARPLALALVLALAGCGSIGRLGEAVGTLGGSIEPYRIDVLQGNVVTREQAAALKPGMPRDQVAGLLGTPLLTSVFHAERWDYVFSFQRQGQPVQQRRLTVFFKDDRLDRVLGDGLPSETEFVASLDARRKPGPEPVLEASEEALRAFRTQNPGPQPASPSSSTASASATPAPVPAGGYPPLEKR